MPISLVFSSYILSMSPKYYTTLACQSLLLLEPTVLTGTWLICQWINFKRTIKCLWIFRVTMWWIIITFFPKGSSTILLSISEAMTVFWIVADPYGRRRWAFMLFCSLLLEAQTSLKWENSATVRLSLNAQFCGLLCFWRHKQLHCFVSHNGFTWAVPACDCLISPFKTQ